MHWSKTRHSTFQECPRRYFYSVIASPRNPEIAALENNRSLPLVRHDIVRNEVINFSSRLSELEGAKEGALLSAEEILKKVTDDEFGIRAELTIIDKCLASFIEDFAPTLNEDDIIYRYNGKPTEFNYDNITMMCLPELVIEKGDDIIIYSFKTGSSNYLNNNDFYQKTGGLTCWARSILKSVVGKVTVSEVYLREGCAEYFAEFDDSKVTEFVKSAKSTLKAYSSSAKIRDFQARPDNNNCRFCNFTTICPEWLEYSEVDYDIETLLQKSKESKTDDSTSSVGEEPESRLVFLSHAGSDKDKFVRPFARTLESEGLSYWLDEAEILWGDSLVKSINKGLKISDYVMCFLSEDYLNTGWPEKELDVALSDEISNKKRRVLPLIIGDKEKVLEEYPILKDKIYLSWEDGVEQIIIELKKIESSNN